MSQSTQKISLSFSKKIEKRSLNTSAIQNNFLIPEIENKYSISSFDKNTKFFEPVKTNEVIIPLVGSKREAILEKLKQKSRQEEKKKNIRIEEDKCKEVSLDERAAAAVLKACSQNLEELERKHTNSGLSIQVNSTENLDINIPNDSGEVSTVEEYEQVNVECFGAAMLRGMGWNKGKGIGRHKRVIEIVNPTNKTFCQTGIERTNKKDVENKEEEEEELKKGSKVLIHSGRNRGTYGVVEAIDEDHLLIRPAKGEHVLREVEQNLRVVSTKEFKELSRVINKEMYDKYKAEEKKEDKMDVAHNMKNLQKRKKEESERREAHDKKWKNECKREKKHSNVSHYKKETKDRRESPPVDKDYHKINKDVAGRKITEEHSPMAQTKYDRSNERDDAGMKEPNINVRKEVGVKDYKMSKTKIQSNVCTPSIRMIPWAQENLRVRIIDKQYKQGIYHKQKVIVRSVETVNICTCVSDDGKVLYDVDPDHLETVIPKASGAIVLVVKGRYKGQKGRILELNKDEEEATLQFLSDKSVLVKLHYDDICEFIAR